MLAIGDEGQHRLVHLKLLVMRKRLLLLAFVEGFLDLCLEEVGLDCVDYLQLG